MKIDTITINNYKSIKEIENLKLTNLNVLIGANGAGKSNFISFFKMLNMIIKENLQDYIKEYNGADNLLHFGLKQSDEMSAKITMNQNSYRFILKPTQGDTLYFKEEATPYIGENIIGKATLETQLFNTQGSKIRGDNFKGVSDYVIDAMQSWKVYHFHDTSSTAKVKGSCTISSSANKELLPNAENLSAFLYYLKLKFPDSFFMIEENIKLIAPYFDKFILEPDIFNEDNIRLEWLEVGSEKVFNAHHLSDGTLRMICLITLLLQPSPPDTIIIDEPELGLHPYAITILSSLMKSFAIRRQLIVSTQSVTLINKFTPNDIIVSDKIKGESHFRRVDEDELNVWLEDYSLGEIWEKNIIGGRP